MEVLIAIGILSIGLTSVAALLPAGGSQARRAIISDRAANLAENALADAATIGLTRPLSLTATAPRVIIDPAGVSPNGLVPAALQTTGILSSATGGTPVSTAIARLFGQGRDDVVLGFPATQDGLPTNSFIDGARGFEGRSSCLWVIESLDGMPVVADKLARLSAVVFHNRDLSTPALSASISATGEISLAPPAGRSIRDVLKAGTVLVVNPVSATPALQNGDSLLFALRSASPTMTGTSAFGVFDRVPPTANCSVLLDSVGLAQAIVTLEGSGPFSSTGPREVVP